MIAVATLGRQETIGNEPHYNEVEKQGTFVTNAITTALTHAHPITDTTLAADNEQFTTKASNTGLMLAMSCNHPGGPLGCPGGAAQGQHKGTWYWELGELFTINRSVEAPYFTAGEDTVGSSTTVARIGNQVYATVPGEGFAEVTEALERIFKASPGIEGEHVIDEGSDTFGYFGDYAAYPAGQMEGDLKTFNIGPNVGQDTVDAAVQAGESLGLDPAAETVTADLINPQKRGRARAPVLPRQRGDRRTDGELLRLGPRGGPGVPLGIENVRLERGNAGRRLDQLELRRRYDRSPARRRPASPTHSPAPVSTP